MTNKYKIEFEKNINIFKKIINEISFLENAKSEDIEHILLKNPSLDKKIFSKTQILQAFNLILKRNSKSLEDNKKKIFLENIRMKKIRTISGVTPVTVLTKPYPCPGQCIFCPNDATMPKSYLPMEPGAQRAEANFFDPYYQTINRLIALKNMGHPTDKIELIILGGTWTSYPLSYQIWFVKRCFDGLNEFDPSKNYSFQKGLSKMPFDEKKLNKIKNKNYTYNQLVTMSMNKSNKKNYEDETWENLFKVHKINETAYSRCIGLVIETRPDEITKDEVTTLRKLGATKVQLGIQSTSDIVLKANRRGHTLAQTKKAVNLLRLAGFKIHAHWMPNLYKSNVAQDKKDFKNLFNLKNIKPDELKVYPCSLIAGTKLTEYYKAGKWRPYSKKELENILTYVFKNTPKYCRITRVIRDIPGSDIVVGNKITNFRQIVENNLKAKSIKINEIRSREIKDRKVEISELLFKKTTYLTDISKEIFMEYITEKGEIAGFLRLSLPNKKNYIKELENSAIIREVHVYGQSLEIGTSQDNKPQHSGLGKSLIKKSQDIAKGDGYKKIAVISSIGTRKYYEKLGFNMCDGKNTLYQHKLI